HGNDLADNGAHRFPPYYLCSFQLALVMSTLIVCPYDQYPARQAAPCPVNKSSREQVSRHTFSCGERLHNLPIRESSDLAGHESRAEITVRLQFIRGTSYDCGMSWQIYGVADDGCGGVRLRSGFRQHGDSVGDAERKAAPVPS